jgi:hypothetical protein
MMVIFFTSLLENVDWALEESLIVFLNYFRVFCVMMLFY